MNTSTEKAKTFVRKSGIQVLLVVSLAVTLVAFTFTQLGERKIADSREKMANTYMLIQSTDRLAILLKEAESCLLGYTLTLDSKYLARFDVAKSDLSDIQETIRRQVEGSREEEEKARVILTSTRTLLNEFEKTLSYVRSTDQEAILQSVQSGGIFPNTDKTFRQIQDFNESQLAPLDSKNTDGGLSLFVSRLIEWSSILFHIAVLILAFISIDRERKSRTSLFRNLNESNKKLLFDDGSRLEDKDESRVIPDLIESLTQATSFIQEVGNNNYTTEYAGITKDNKNLNKDNLAGELLRMRDQISKVAQDEQRRNWTTTGIAKFAEILRNERDNLADLTDSVLNNLVKYAGANQGGLFLLNNDDSSSPYLELKSCYAYDRKKFVHKQIQPGEGLIGQAYLEKDVIFLTEVPENYVTITSGLGNATPRCILIIPLKVNEEVLGAIELVSFKVFEAFEIDFIQKVGESIASTIISVKTNEVTKQLLIEAQSMTEEMKAQEEEMRQNMEELSATQEEMHRKEKEYIRRIQELEQTGALLPQN